VLLNLQSNALKFTKSGGVVEIKVYYIKASKLGERLPKLRNSSQKSLKTVDSYYIKETDPLQV
jgi:signal transduction histidine kinase